MTHLCKNASTDMTEYIDITRPHNKPQQSPSDIQQLIANVRELLGSTHKSTRESFTGVDMTLRTIIDDFGYSPESYYIPLIDISSQIKRWRPRPYVLPTDLISQTYFASLGAVGLYILYRFMEKTH